MGWYTHRFWEKTGDFDDAIDCTAEEMKQAVDGYIGTENTLLNDPNTITIANMVCLYVQFNYCICCYVFCSVFRTNCLLIILTFEST